MRARVTLFLIGLSLNIVCSSNAFSQAPDPGPPSPMRKLICQMSSTTVGAPIGSRELKTFATVNDFWIEDESNSQFYARSSLFHDGGLAFDVRLRRDGERSQSIQGHEYFEAAILYFGERIKYISAQWTSGDNLKKFNELTEGGTISDEDAALGTWTGKNAAKFGYDFVEITDLRGRPGNYSSVKVEFRK